MASKCCHISQQWNGPNYNIFEWLPYLYVRSIAFLNEKRRNYCYSKTEGFIL